MRTFVLAAAAATATAAAVAVPGAAHALPGGVLTYCNATVPASPDSFERDLAIVASAYSIDAGVVATWVRCTVRTGSTVWGTTESVMPGSASVAAGTATVPPWTDADVCVTGYVMYTNGWVHHGPETCQPLPAPPL